MLSWMAVSLHSRCAGSINLHTKHWDCMCSLLQGSTEHKYFINNHLSFKVQYHNDGVSETSRIVGFDVRPYRWAFVVCVGCFFYWDVCHMWLSPHCGWNLSGPLEEILLLLAFFCFFFLRSHLFKKLTRTHWSYWDTHCSGNTAASMSAWIVWQVYM